MIMTLTTILGYLALVAAIVVTIGISFIFLIWLADRICP